jgi:hypothetical protein
VPSAAVSCSQLQPAAVSCSLLQSVAVSCSQLQSVAASCRQLQFAAVCCSQLQSVAVSCSLLQSAAVSCSQMQFPTSKPRGPAPHTHRTRHKYARHKYARHIYTRRLRTPCTAPPQAAPCCRAAPSTRRALSRPRYRRPQGDSSDRPAGSASIAIERTLGSGSINWASVDGTHESVAVPRGKSKKGEPPSHQGAGLKGRGGLIAAACESLAAATCESGWSGHTVARDAMGLDVAGSTGTRWGWV